MIWKLKQRQQQWLAEEKGTIRKDWGGKVRVALAFPNRYSVGMSNLGFQSVYGAMNRLEYVVCERVFYPEPEDLPLLRQNPGSLLAVESQRPIHDFHLLAFSVPFENDYVNVVEMLALAGIPPRADQREKIEPRVSLYPLVAAGGIAIFLNPEPLAPFIDFLFVGEAEVFLPDFWTLWKNFQDQPKGDTHREFLKVLAKEVPGIYVPSLYRPIYDSDGFLETIQPEPGYDLPERIPYQRTDLAHSPVCQTVILTPNTEFSNVNLLELGRGCGRGCRFCAAGYVYRPPRFRPAEQLVETSKAMLPETSRVGLVSAAVSDHPQIDQLCHSLTELGISISFSSLRADTITPEILSALKSGHHQGVAIAPEAGSERLRQVINKHLNAEQIYKAVEQLTEVGILHLKLYFMIGLPTEIFEDLEAIVDLTKRIKHHVLKKSRGQKRLGTITVSIHSFVPKPFTPFQWVAFAGIRELKERARWIQKALRKVSNVRVHFDLPKWAYVQALLARGDRRVAVFLEKVVIERLNWTQAMREVPLNTDFWVSRTREQREPFPWEIVDFGIKRAYLWEEYQKALRGTESLGCLAERHCRNCGVCED
jgi:radical SAM superfamily enzyme YgiQ (UPF0313 family)